MPHLHTENKAMNLVRIGSLACAVAGAALLTGCVVAPADGVYYGDAYPTYSTGGYSYGYGGTPYYGGTSLVIESSPTYVYGGGRPYYRPGGHYRPGNPHYHGGNGNYRPPTHSSRPSLSPGTGAQLGRPIGRGGPPSAPSRSGGNGGGRFGSSWQQR